MAAVFAAVLVLLLIQFLAVPRWPETRAEQWTALAALAASTTALAALAGLGTLVVAARNAAQSWQQRRADLAPYLRVDFAPDRGDGTWTPTTVPPGYSFAFADLNPGVEPEPTALDAWSVDGAGATDLAIWVRNQQTAAAAVAVNVLVEVELEFPDRATAAHSVLREEVILHYLEPGRAVRYRVARVSDAIPYVIGRVVGVTYFDMFQNPLAFAHGSAAFEWSAGTLVNHRLVFEER